MINLISALGLGNNLGGTLGSLQRMHKPGEEKSFIGENIGAYDTDGYAIHPLDEQDLHKVRTEVEQAAQLGDALAYSDLTNSLANTSGEQHEKLTGLMSALKPLIDLAQIDKAKTLLDLLYTFLVKKSQTKLADYLKILEQAPENVQTAINQLLKHYGLNSFENTKAHYDHCNDSILMPDRWDELCRLARA